MTPTHRLVLSTVGASLLYNHPVGDGSDHRARLNRVANNPTLSPDEAAALAPSVAQAETTLAGDDLRAIRRASAELNGIYAFYDNQIGRGAQDVHVLVATDTALGRQCATLVAAHLHRHGIATILYVVEQLTTATTADFDVGSKHLIHWCAQNIPDYRAQGYRVVFNLVAAFKALQGYLNTIGMFYADEILYLFEGPAASPILIPRLPLKIDLAALTPFAVPLALMAEAYAELPLADLADLSPALYDTRGDHALISAWGELTWEQIRDDLLGSDLLPFPRLRYEPGFGRDVRGLSRSERVQLQATLAQVAAILTEDGGNPARLKQHGGLQYDNYRGKQVQGTPIGHFRFGQGPRVSCIAEAGGLTLRHCGAHDYVNTNP
jgi:putative CRISPR-associated protein (TIGR02619 family)